MIEPAASWRPRPTLREHNPSAYGRRTTFGRRSVVAICENPGLELVGCSHGQHSLTRLGKRPPVLSKVLDQTGFQRLLGPRTLVSTSGGDASILDYQPARLERGR
jgi:hypothetical protein